MTKKTFSAQQWLQREVDHDSPVPTPQLPAHESCPIKGRFPPFIRNRNIKRRLIQDDSKFSPVGCFVPGWKGESLSSKNVIRFERLLGHVQQDVKNELFRNKDFPRVIKTGLFEEFISYAETLGLHFEGIDDHGRFWQLMDASTVAEDERLAKFVDVYCGRVATITFLKLRFMASLVDRCNLQITDRALLSPTSFLSNIFKKGSQTDLNSRALESNHYSWYRPQDGMKDVMKELLTLSKDLAITEIIKNVSGRTQVAHDQGKIYSHALSHVSFGLFLNSLQINFPMWLGAIEGRHISPNGLDQEEIISSKYAGDYLESLSLSHWLAQENNKDFRWDEMICPVFEGREFAAGLFTKVCNELQFLTFLAHKAEYQSERPIEYICKIVNGHLKNRKNVSVNQNMMLEENNPFLTSTYDRVVLNICHFPKNNPQHYLMAQILDQVKSLKNDGYLFVLSSKKLFVPSLRERIGTILKELKTEAIFDLENVKGKGELGSYVYIFRKKSEINPDKQLCSYFRISAELEAFQEFADITEHLRSFYLAHLNEVPSMGQLDFPDSFRLQFYQEAVVGGMLINSTNEDATRITHPAFFKGLLESCVPFESIFDIRSISMDEIPRENALNIGLKKDTSYFMVVDFRKDEVNLELHPMATYRSIVSEYGNSLCSYFELHPKIQGLNPNIVRNFFLTPIGRQVANLTFTGGQMVKGRLTKLLIPKFLTQTEALPQHLRTAFKLFEMNEQELLESAPQSLLKAFNHTDQITRDLLPHYGCEILSLYSALETTLKGLIWKMDDGRFGQKFSFNNPFIQSQLIQRPTRNLYPDNADIFLEFVDGSSPSDINLPLTSTQMRISHEGDLKLYCLELLSGDKLIVRLHSEEPMLMFVNFIFNEAHGVAISKLLRAVHVPSLTDLKTVIETTQTLKIIYSDLLDKVNDSIMNAFRVHVKPRQS